MMAGLTRSESDAALIRYAANIARLGTITSARFVHVLPESSKEDHTRVCDELMAVVRSIFAGNAEAIPLECDVLHGPLVDRFLQHVAEKQADLLLIGDRRGVAGRRPLARRLAMKAPCSVWLVPEGAPSQLQRILVPVDFSESAADCIRVATSMARLRGLSEVLALHVYFNEAAVTYEGYDQVIRGEETADFNRFMAPIDRQGITVTPILEEGSNVAHAIGRAAEKHGVDLIVMGTRGRSRSASILLGSVTEEMIQDSRVPLLAVKHFGARMGVLQALLDRRFWQQGELHT
jgi:nucleotide-binding universal stress UspA family protein